MVKIREKNSSKSYFVNAVKAFQTAEVVSFNEVALMLWNGKLLLLFVALLFGGASFLYLDRLPVIYQSEVKLDLSEQVYANIGISEVQITQRRLDSLEFKNDLAKAAGITNEQNLANVRYNERDRTLTVYARSQEPNVSRRSVQMVVEHINDAIKDNEVRRLRFSLDATRTQEINEWGDTIQSTIGNIQAMQLYRISVLNNADTKLVTTVALDSIKEKKIGKKSIAIVLLFSFLGAGIGTIIVLVFTTFKRFRNHNSKCTNSDLL